MKLVIVRHAIAEERDAAAWPDDGTRPLTKRGRKRFKTAARGLWRLAPLVDVVLSSPYVRAWDTALILEREAAWPAPLVCNELKGSLPEEVLRALAPYRHLQMVAVVGHEPHLSRLIGQILSPSGSMGIELKKGGAACIDLSGDAPTLLWLLQPRTLRQLA